MVGEVGWMDGSRGGADVFSWTGSPALSRR
jgi:hypothetical protein